MAQQDQPAEPVEQYHELLARYQDLVSKYQGISGGPTRRHRLGELLLEHTTEAIALFQGGRVVSCNRRYHEFCSRQPQWRRLGEAGGDEQATLQGLLVQCTQELEDPEQPRSLCRVRPSAVSHPILEVTALLVEGGPVPQVAVILRDLTEAERHATELRGSVRRDEFLATLAHELRNPLTPIVGAAEYLLQTSTDAVTRHFAEIILRQARHQSHMIEDLLDISRVREGKLRLTTRPTDLREVVQDAVESTERHREAGPVLELALPGEPVWVEGDPTRLVQVVTNLLTNAAKFTPAEGKNWLELKSGEGIAWLQVRDSGRGIAPELISRVWETFVQEEREGGHAPGGLGLGLSLVRSLAELHGGGVRAASDGIGAGAEFTVWLPLCPTPERLARPEKPSHGAPLRILIVEDNDDARETLQELLSTYGHTVTAARNFAEAMRLALQVRPEAILSDLRLPDRDSLGLPATLRPLLPRTTYVAMSGHLSPEMMGKARAAGFDACLQKPLDLEGLLRSVHGQ